MRAICIPGLSRSYSTTRNGIQSSLYITITGGLCRISLYGEIVL